MVMMRAGQWTVAVYLHRDTPDSPVVQRVQVKDRGYLVYDGLDLGRAQIEAEKNGLRWADLQLVADDSGTAAAG